jgi:hypothetical protein
MPYKPKPMREPKTPIELARDRNESRLMGIAGVLGTGIGRAATGEDAIVVYVRDSSVKPRVPSRIEKYPVEVVVTGDIKAL